MILGLVPTWQEGRLSWTALASLLPACDHIAAFDGPIGDAPPSGHASVLPKPSNTIHIQTGAWPSDAAKRTAMLRWAQARTWLSDEDWLVWLDGDEVLLWGEYLPDLIDRASEEADELTVVGGFPIRLHELDGTTSVCLGRIVRVGVIAEYIVSSFYVRKRDGSEAAIGNVPVWNWRQGPMLVGGTPEQPEIDPRCRPASPGEPQILHRSAWRSKGRTVQRQSEAEAVQVEAGEVPGL